MRFILPVVFIGVCTCVVSSNRIRGEGTNKGTKMEILTLKVERLQAASDFGENHPIVKMLDKQIELLLRDTSTVTAAQPMQDHPPIDTGNDELFGVVKQLLRRVERLEKEVAELKGREPRIELLAD